MLPFILGGAAVLGVAAFGIQSYLAAEERRKNEQRKREWAERQRYEQTVRETAEKRKQEERRREQQKQEEEKRRQEEERQILDSGIYQADEMSGREFEELLSLCFRKIGYLVTITSYSQDYGADLILYRNDAKFVVQAKRSQKPVGVRAVQEVVGAIKHYKAHKGMVITNNVFTENAYSLAASNDVELIDREKLIQLMLSAKRGY